MNEFDIKAKEWDSSSMHRERAKVVADEIIRRLPLTKDIKALEYGAGTGLLSFNLRENLGEITMIDSSEGMVNVLNDKIRHSGSDNMKAAMVNLENEDYTVERFDLIYTLMVLHHVNNIDRVLDRFSNMLVPGGYLAIADLHSEDGSFHGEGFSGHRGFDTGRLAARLLKYGFTDVDHSDVYLIDKITADSTRKQFQVFLMTAVRK
ncbi:MAG: class I SAM-dependent methyltransferase [Bacteroidales bacterium]|nr:class I SAM-dependent methyltransferase [Bacteroidales bacterium]